MPRHDRIDSIAVAMLVGICALWGLQQVMVKAAVAAGIGPLPQAALRSTGAAMLFLGWAAVVQGRAGGARHVPAGCGAAVSSCWCCR